MATDFDYNRYRRTYNARHPEKLEQWRINAAVNLLRRVGYTVTAPDQQPAATQTASAAQAEEMQGGRNNER